MSLFEENLLLNHSSVRKCLFVKTETSPGTIMSSGDQKPPGRSVAVFTKPYNTAQINIYCFECGSLASW